MSGDPYCADAAREEGAPLAGTASRAELWLLLEHDAAWSADAIADNDLPAPLQAWMAAQLASLGAIGKARALLVRREAGGGEPAPRGRRGFLAVTREDRQELHAFTAAAPAGPAELDVAGALARGELPRHADRLTLVCVNGRRDRCCARRGAPTYRALAEGAPMGSVWQSSHQGGHRYAATGLWLPEGVAYGYLGPEDAPALRAARSRGAVHLPRFRGRVFHPAPVQAADALLRRELGIDALDAWRLEGVHGEGEGIWRVSFAGPAGRYAVLVEAREEMVLAGCTPPKQKRSERFLLRSWSGDRGTGSR